MIRRASWLVVLTLTVLTLTGCPLAVLEVRGGYHLRPEPPAEIAPLILVASPRSAELDLFGLVVPLVPISITCPGHESDQTVVSMLRVDECAVDPWTLRLLAADGTWTAPSTVLEEPRWWSLTFATSHRAGTPLTLRLEELLVRLEPTTSLRLGFTFMLFEEPLSWWWRWSWRS